MVLSSDAVRTIGSAVTIGAAVVSVAIFIAKLDGRVSDLESKVHALNLAPAINQALTSSNKGEKLPDQGIAPKSGSVETYAQSSLEGNAIPNPVAQVCADLIRRSADAIGKSNISIAQDLRALMDQVGCTTPTPRSKPK